MPSMGSEDSDPSCTIHPGGVLLKENRDPLKAILSPLYPLGPEEDPSFWRRPSYFSSLAYSFHPQLRLRVLTGKHGPKP